MLDEKHQKYKFMETNLVTRRRRLKGQIPDITSSLAMIEELKSKKAKSEDTETEFLLSDQVYAKAVVPPTDKVRNKTEPQTPRHKTSYSHFRFACGSEPT